MVKSLLEPADKNSSKSSLERQRSEDLPLALKPPATRRKQLPHEQIYGDKIPIIAIITKNLPACVFEPLGDVQIVAEEFRYAKQFLDKMPSIEDPAERFALLCGFIASGYSGMAGRRRKPFNPLLGETYDYISEDGWRYHGEKVSHHPSITACHTEGQNWEIFQALHGNISFTLNSVSITSLLPVRLTFTNGDEYSWKKVTTTIQNVRSEAHKRRVLNSGEMIITSNTGIEGRLVFHGNEDNTITGEVFRTCDSVTLYSLSGTWDKGLNRISPSNQVSKLFKPIPPSKHSVNYYGFSDFAMALNELHDYEHSYLPVTDSRFRPDQRYLENGEAKLTEKVKKQLEQAQRKRANLPHTPQWFHKEADKFTGDYLWHSNRLYWDSKETQFQNEHSRQMVQLFEKEH